VILSPVSSAIEVRTVIGRVAAVLPVFWDAAGAANAPETALDAGALVKLAGKEMASVREAVGLFRPSPGQANGVRRGRWCRAHRRWHRMARLRRPQGVLSRPR
jgi:hypothetical protein